MIKLKYGSGWRGLLVGMMVLGLMACTAATERMTQLDDTLNMYEKSMRWGQFARAASLHNPVLDAQQMENISALKDVRVSSYAVMSSRLVEKGTGFLQSVEIKYFFDADPVLRTLVAQQVWAYHSERKMWFISSAFPEFVVNQ